MTQFPPEVPPCGLEQAASAPQPGPYPLLKQQPRGHCKIISVPHKPGMITRWPFCVSHYV